MIGRSFGFISLAFVLWFSVADAALAQNGPWLACSKACNMHCDPRDLRNPNTISACFRDQKECVNYCLNPPPPPVHGTFSPRYFVLTVIYAPPGTQAGRSTSSVSYASGSSTGTTTSTSQSFKQSYGVGLTTGVGFLGNGGQAGLSFTYGHSDQQSNALDIKKTTTTTLQYSGSSQDGINHDRDLIYLWLNPVIDVALTSKTVNWTFNGSTTADIQYVYVGNLKNPATMPPGVAQALQRHGITPADYPDILAHDPLAMNPDAVETSRFQPTHFTVTYEPPFGPNDPVPVMSYNLSNSSVQTNGKTTTNSYTVRLTIEGDASFLGLAKASLKNEDSWEWTNTSSVSNSSGSTETANLSIGGPAFGYTGATDVEVFYDTIYKTFAFRMVQGSPVALTGTLSNAAGQALAGHEVTLMLDGTKYRTMSDAKGHYRILGALSGSAVVQVDRTSRPLDLTGRSTTLNISTSQ